MTAPHPVKVTQAQPFFPSLFALADGRGLTGQDLATYLALAYEISYRAGLTQHDTCTDYHTSGAWTAVGVAAMTARILGCDAAQIHEAAGIGEYHGPRSQMMRCIDHPTMVRDGVGWGAPTGVTAGVLAQTGFTGAPALTCQGPQWWGLGRQLETGDRHPLQALPLLPLVSPKYRRRSRVDGESWAFTS